MADLGYCAFGLCDRPATVFVAGPTLGPSPRLTIIGGDRAKVLADNDQLHGSLDVRCTDCAVAMLEAVAAEASRA